MELQQGSRKIYGGNIVERTEIPPRGKCIFASGAYDYYLYNTGTNETVVFDGLRSFTVYILQKDPGSVVKVVQKGWDLGPGDCIQSENETITIEVRSSAVRFLVAGTITPQLTLRGASLCRSGDVHKVSKPWGHELWINGEHPCYAFKQIYIKRGTKTSLQYHNFKHETNILFEGSARLHYKRDQGVSNDNVLAQDIDTVRIDAISSVCVPPPVVHRLEAVTDIMLYEASTPHVDDVIRLHDDAGRPNGRIEAEHLVR